MSILTKKPITKVAIIDYGVGNLFSLESSLAHIGADAEIASCARQIKEASHIILPGVGAFEDAAKKLKESGMQEEVEKAALSGKPLMGICLGMQLLLEKSLEYGDHKGLGLIKGAVRPLEEITGKELKIPHIGWNSLSFPAEKCPIFKYTDEGSYVYFVHSYYAKPDNEKDIAATATYGAPVTAAVCRDNIFGCQFHPEKSGGAGLDILKAFCEI